jgi:uncharacterized repeat protein (TIGR03847 family)
VSAEESFEFDEVDRLTAGAVGPPGQRVFYLQASAGGEVVTLKVEKGQVAALVTYITALLSDLPPIEPPSTDMSLIEPVVPEWVVGALGVSYDELSDRVVLLAQELVVRDESATEEEDDDDEDLDAGVARFTATRAQAAALAARGLELVAAGRPTCSLCGNPIDPEGHVCPRLNGHKRPG